MAPFDRLSALPDSVVCHILSFLPTKISVSTSILARRWRFLWAYVPNLKFNSYDHHSGTSFLNFINRVMLLHKVQKLNSFALSYNCPECCDDQLETCIKDAVVRNVRDLYLDLGMEVGQPVLPRCLFTCKTLINLTLHLYGGIPLSVGICLPALKKLCLLYVQYDSDEPLPRLLTGCPVLEDLIVDKLMRFDTDIVCVYISSPTLKRLTFSCERRFNPETDSMGYKLKIDTPALRYLQIEDSVSEIVSDGGLTSLVEADIDLSCFGPTEGNALYSRSVIEFVGVLNIVKCLKLKLPESNNSFSALTMKFHNLTKLKLGADWGFLSYFLGNADNLQVLVISNEVKDCLKYWVDPKQVPTCLLSHLETVKIDNFEFTEPEFKMIRYLLRNAQVLKMMKICPHYYSNLKPKFDALKRIASFQRGSEACQLVFDD